MALKLRGVLQAVTLRSGKSGDCKIAKLKRRGIVSEHFVKGYGILGSLTDAVCFQLLATDTIWHESRIVNIACWTHHNFCGVFWLKAGWIYSSECLSAAQCAGPLAAGCTADNTQRMSRTR